MVVKINLVIIVSSYFYHIYSIDSGWMSVRSAPLNIITFNPPLDPCLFFIIYLRNRNAMSKTN